MIHNDNVHKVFDKEAEHSVIESLDCDVVVIGGGGSGLVAAVKAAEEGAGRVIILEKGGRPGGNAMLAVGMFAVNSSAQQREGIKTITCDGIFKEAMEASKWATDPKIVRAYIEKSGELVRWLEEKKMEFKVVHERFHQVTSADKVQNRKDPSHGPGFVGSSVVETMVKQCEKLGIKILTNTKAVRISVDSTGKVNGVLASGQNKQIKICTTSVVIAAGGFGANEDMLKKYFPEFFRVKGPLNRLSTGHSTGDGITMAEELGAVTGENMGIQILGPAHHPWAYSIHIAVTGPECLWVNKNGERFMDEAAGFHGYHALSRQPGAVLYALIDSETKKYMQQNFNMIKRAADSHYLAKLDDDIKEEEKDGIRVRAADSLNEIAEFIGADPDVLKETVARYNSFCDKGHDEEYAKDKEFLRPLRTPPYYAMLGVRFFDTTHGGIKINHHMEVIDTNDNVIQGLYATGDNASGWVTQNYGPPAASLTWCFNSGLIAGENVAKYVSCGKGAHPI